MGRAVGQQTPPCGDQPRNTCRCGQEGPGKGARPLPPLGREGPGTEAMLVGRKAREPVGKCFFASGVEAEGSEAGSGRGVLGDLPAKDPTPPGSRPCGPGGKASQIQKMPLLVFLSILSLITHTQKKDAPKGSQGSVKNPTSFSRTNNRH